MKKVLIITYYWPPAGGPGVQRWLKFVKYLPEFGILPIVYIPENPEYPIVDQKLVDDVSPDTIILKNRIWEPFRLASLFSKNRIRKISSGIVPSRARQSLIEKIVLWIRGNLFIPDARVFWVSPSVRYLKRYISENNIDTIITTGPPHSLHLIGQELKSALKINWIADFRDPWTTIGYHKSLRLSKYAANRHKVLEKKVLTTADRIIVTSNTTRDEFMKITAKPIEVITNGYDIQKLDVKLDSKFTVSHIGSMLSGRNPEILWEVFAEMISGTSGFADDFELHLIGIVSDEVLESIRLCNLSPFTTVTPYLSHENAVIRQQQSQLLLLVEIDSADTRSIIPGKLFEYLVSGRPIIAMGPQGSDIADIIADTNTGVFIGYSDKESLKRTLSDYYESFRSGRLSTHADGIEKYSRKNLTAKLAEILKQWG